MPRTPHNPWPDLPHTQHPALIVPSLLSVDFYNAAPQIEAVLAAGAHVLHMDIMDGHFVPNLSMGVPVVEKIRRSTDAALDVHLMVTNPGQFIEPFAQAGADSLTFHIEACDDIDQARRLIEQIRTRGLGVGVTLKPTTPLAAIDAILPDVDLVLMMTVEPGFGGQPFLDSQLPKLRELRGIMQPHQRLEVDGGIVPETAARCRAAGADCFVAGHFIFGGPNPAEAVAALRAAVG